MWKSLARDVFSMISAVVVLVALASALWFAAVFWVLPPSAMRPHFAYLPFAAPLVVALAGIGVLLYVPLRGRARWGRPIAAPHWRDTLVAPLLAGVVVGLVLLLIVLGVGEKNDALLAGVGGVTMAAALALASGVVVFVQRFTSRPVRALGVAAGVLVVVWLGGGAFLDWWGRRVFASYKAVAVQEIAAERARIAADRRPVLFGAPIDENAADRYRRLSQVIAERLAGSEALRILESAVKAGPGLRPEAQVARWVEAAQPELLSLREAVRCTRCDWQYSWEQGPAAPLPSLLGARYAADLLVIEGYQKAAAGDFLGAVERDLEVIRMGTDYESSGALIGALMAVALERIGTDALLRLLASDGLAGTPQWDEILARLDLLEPRLASMGVGFRGERLSYVGWEKLALGELTGVGALPVVDLLFPGRFLVADSIRTLDQALRSVEKANEVTDPREAARLTQAALDEALRSRNLLVHMGLPSMARARAAQDQELARFRILRATILLEKAWAKDGRYPGSADALDLPIDPFAHPNRLRYAVAEEGRGYRLWSVGIDGTDEEGVDKAQTDEVFERPPRSGPAPQARLQPSRER